MTTSRWIAGLAGLLCCTAAHAGKLDAAVQELMIKSGIEKQTSSFPDHIRAGMQQARRQGQGQPDMTDTEYAALEDAAAKAYNAGAIRAAVAREFATGLTAADINAALAWLDSPVGARITRLEEAASTTAAYTAMQAWARGLREGDIAPARLERVRRLDRAIRATEFGVNVAVNTQLAIVAAFMATRPAAEQAQAFEAMKAQLDQSRDQLFQATQQETLASLLYAYRDLADADLERYIAFSESPAGRKYMEVAMKGFDRALVDAARNAGRLIAEQLKQKKQKAAHEAAPLRAGA